MSPFYKGIAASDSPMVLRRRAMSAPTPITRGKVPPWLAQLGVKAGGYFTDSKPRAKRAMTSSGFSPATRIHIYLGLATMGYWL